MRLEQLLRELAPQVLGSVVRRHRDFSAAEDAVQEALLAAASQWPGEGVPENPRGWLIHVAIRRLTDQARSEIARRKRETALTEDPALFETIMKSPDNEEVAAKEDDTLVLLFMCCHPSLTRPSAIALTLRAVGGLTTAEIARAFMVPEATMAQRISRAKATIKQSGVGFEMPGASERDARLSAVLHVLYLVFNEGYAASSGDAVHRVDLSSEAIRLARAVHAMLPEHGEVTGLLALMLLTDARKAAREGPNGELIPLDEQDRSLWDRSAIEEGVALVTSAFERHTPGAYQLQAAIAALHDEAESTEKTDWSEIAQLYELLQSLSDNPMVRLSHAVAVAMVKGPEEGLRLIGPLEKDDRLTASHRLPAVQAHLHERAGNRPRAIALYKAAAELTSNKPERDYLLRKLAHLTDN